MRAIKTLFSLVAICLSSLLMSPTSHATALEADYIVAVVGDTVITRNELRSRLEVVLKQLTKQGRRCRRRKIWNGRCSSA